jgi:hypothetical protein
LNQCQGRYIGEAKVAIVENGEILRFDGGNDLFAQFLENSGVKSVISLGLCKLAVSFRDLCSSGTDTMYRDSARMDWNDVRLSSADEVGKLSEHEAEVTVNTASTCRVAGSSICVDFATEFTNAEYSRLTDDGSEYWMREGHGWRDGGHDEGFERVATVAAREV